MLRRVVEGIEWAALEGNGPDSMEKKKQKSQPPAGGPRTSARRRRLGQHFLRDESVTTRILSRFAPAPDDRILEVGPGPGALTDHLAGAVAALVAVELDVNLADKLRRRFAGDATVTIIQGDILKIDWDQIIGSGDHDRRCRLLGNLPYSVATPLLIRALQRGDLFSDLMVMVQREVAWRLLAEPGGGDYGPLAVLVSLLCRDARLILQVPPGAFSPPPQVHSAVVALTLDPVLPSPAITAGVALARRAFMRRRKKLINALDSPAPPVVAGALEKLALATDARPEEIRPEDYVRLAHLLNSMETT
jgi:16S rRNA (adenine1518-N6/adenine1519-N6)-dimethyltransferase